jgi:hypothetical protein
MGAAVEGVDDVEGAREGEGVIEKRAPEGVAVLDGAVGAMRREGGLCFCRLAPLQFLFSQHSKLEQMINSIVFLIVNNVLNFSMQPEIKTTNFILRFLMNTNS